jgi:tRNA (guanine-N7-)-methyltransferase
MNDHMFRHIRSFVRRGGHITQAQRDSRASMLPQWGIPYSTEPVDLKAVFPQPGRLILEIGFGMGETTAAMAQAHPDWNFLAVDIYRPGVGSLLARIKAIGLHNIRIIEHDIVEVLSTMIVEPVFDAVHIYFPDPWPKTRHHKRRLIQQSFLDLLTSRMAGGGVLHLASDWPDYVSQMRDVCLACAQLQPVSADGIVPRPEWRPQTKFETRGLRLGHPVADLLFQKRDTATSTSTPAAIR